MAVKFYNVPDLWISRCAHWPKWLEAVAENEGKRLGDFIYRFQTDEELLELNRSFLNHDTYTDIITFDRTRGLRISADVAISWERVLDNARHMNAVVEDEVDRVLVHAVLHTCGYLDKSVDDERNMRSLEDQYLAIRPDVLLHVEQ
jgi:rRNA maturation RNase YbeY